MKVVVPLRIRVVVLTACGLLAVSGCSSWLPDPTGGNTQPSSPPVSASPAPKPVVAKIEDAFPSRPMFGITAGDGTEAPVAAVAQSAGCRPTMVQRFISVHDGFSYETLSKTASGIPILSIEPWRPNGGVSQTDFTLRATTEGKWDQQYLKIANAIVRYQKVVLVRFAHEMNGHWYPWGATNGNRAEDYGAAYRHVVELFKAAGATNVLWVWSPNIIRSTHSKTIAEYWPGDEYVDVIGVTGYGVRESSPEQTYRPTLQLVDKLAAKPILLTEVGVQPDSTKRRWITEFGPWLVKNPKVAGFVWYEKVREGDWRFSDSAANLAAFKNSLAVAGVKCP